MSREMRRKNQALTFAESEEILRRGTSGVLAVLGEDGSPYAVPLSYVYESGKVYFHCARTGYKLDAVRRNPKVSFCVVDRDQVVPAEYTAYFRSIILFGEARILNGEPEKRQALEKLAAKYSPDDEKGQLAEIDRLFQQVCMVEITVTELTGKEAIELRRKGGEA